MTSGTDLDLWELLRRNKYTFNLTKSQSFIIFPWIIDVYIKSWLLKPSLKAKFHQIFVVSFCSSADLSVHFKAKLGLNIGQQAWNEPNKWLVPFFLRDPTIKIVMMDREKKMQPQFDLQ